MYMSPEVLHGKGYDLKSDVWSLGCLLYELATLRTPFKSQGDNLYVIFKKINECQFERLPEVCASTLFSWADVCYRVNFHQNCARLSIPSSRLMLLLDHTPMTSMRWHSI